MQYEKSYNRYEFIRIIIIICLHQHRVCYESRIISIYPNTHTKANGVNDERLMIQLSEANELSNNQKKALTAVYFKSGSFNTRFQRNAIDLIIAQDNLTEDQANLIEEIASNSQYYNGIKEEVLLPEVIRRNVDARTVNLVIDLIRKPYNDDSHYTDSLVTILRRCPFL